MQGAAVPPNPSARVPAPAPLRPQSLAGPIALPAATPALHPLLPGPRDPFKLQVWFGDPHNPPRLPPHIEKSRRGEGLSGSTLGVPSGPRCQRSRRPKNEAAEPSAWMSECGAHDRNAVHAAARRNGSPHPTPRTPAGRSHLLTGRLRDGQRGQTPGGSGAKVSQDKIKGNLPQGEN